MRAVIEAAGFTEVEFSSRRWQSFADAPFESSAAAFGTEGVAILAVKPVEALPAVARRTRSKGWMEEVS